MNVRPGLTKVEPTSSAETLRQPLFGNPSILNTSDVPLGLGVLREDSTFARYKCTRIKDLWSNMEKEWKRLSELGMSYHTSNKRCKEAIIASIPWCPDECTSHPQPGEWIGNPNSNPDTPLN